MSRRGFAVAGQVSGRNWDACNTVLVVILNTLRIVAPRVKAYYPSRQKLLRFEQSPPSTLTRLRPLQQIPPHPRDFDSEFPSAPSRPIGHFHLSTSRSGELKHRLRQQKPSPFQKETQRDSQPQAGELLWWDTGGIHCRSGSIQVRQGMLSGYSAGSIHWRATLGYSAGCSAAAGSTGGLLWWDTRPDSLASRSGGIHWPATLAGHWAGSTGAALAGYWAGSTGEQLWRILGGIHWRAALAGYWVGAWCRSIANADSNIKSNNNPFLSGPTRNKHKQKEPMAAPRKNITHTHTPVLDQGQSAEAFKRKTLQVAERAPLKASNSSSVSTSTLWSKATERANGRNFLRAMPGTTESAHVSNQWRALVSTRMWRVAEGPGSKEILEAFDFAHVPRSDSRAFSMLLYAAHLQYNQNSSSGGCGLFRSSPVQTVNWEHHKTSARTLCLLDIGIGGCLLILGRRFLNCACLDEMFLGHLGNVSSDRSLCGH